jgi:hypothetical protein
MESKFAERVAQLPRKQCQCWDCLRELGLTPPRKEAKDHAPMDNPRSFKEYVL